ncbi:MAG: 50S ribosomal protein L23 [Patescibacteria group bacterium]|nr:50S ribosomal protein L23 [Patescibacteria group bacterium]
MPLFGFRKDKKHEQSHIQAQAEMAKATAPGNKGKAPARNFKSAKPASISKAVVTKDEGAAKIGPAMPKGGFSDASDAVVRPRITEKSGILSQGGVYTFEVANGANKPAIAKTVAALYKVTPVKIAIINGPSRRVFVRGKRGVVPGIRKAVVTVKKGEKIDFI